MTQTSTLSKALAAADAVLADDPELVATHQAADDGVPRMTVWVARFLTTVQEAFTPTAIGRILNAGNPIEAAEALITARTNRMLPVQMRKAELWYQLAKAEELFESKRLEDIHLDIMGKASGDLEPALDLVDPNVVAEARENAGRMITGITGQVRNSVSDAITGGVRGNLTRPEVERLIRGSVGMNRQQTAAYNNMIAAANNAVAYENLADIPDPLERQRVRRAQQYRLQGRTKLRPGMSRDQADRMLDQYEQRAVRHRAETIARTECLPGDTPISGAEVTGLTRRWWSGDVVEVVCASGRSFTATPNHPVLTVNGWAPLGAISEGDYLICDSLHVEEPRAAGDQDEHDGPATIGEIFEAAQAVWVTQRERTGEPDFHGDGVPDGDVDVLRPDGVLRAGDFAPITQPRLDLVLSEADAAEVLGACESAPFVRKIPAAQVVRSGWRAERDPGFGEDASDRPRRHTEIVSNGSGVFSVRISGDDLLDREIVAPVRGVPALAHVGAASVPERTCFDTGSAQMIPDGGRIESEGVADDSVGHPGPVHLDHVVHVGQRHFAGHVYNFSTTDGYFAANGVYTGNTMRASNAGRWGAIDQAMRDGELPQNLIKIWVTAPDDRTCPICRPLDGQEVGMRDGFISNVQGLDPRNLAPSRERTAKYPPLHPRCRCTLSFVTPGGKPAAGEFDPADDGDPSRARGGFLSRMAKRWFRSKVDPIKAQLVESVKARAFDIVMAYSQDQFVRWLRRFDGMTVDEIGDALFGVSRDLERISDWDITDREVMTRLQRALRSGDATPELPVGFRPFGELGPGPPRPLVIGTGDVDDPLRRALNPVKATNTSGRVIEDIAEVTVTVEDRRKAHNIFRGLRSEAQEQARRYVSIIDDELDRVLGSHRVLEPPPRWKRVTGPFGEERKVLLDGSEIPGEWEWWFDLDADVQKRFRERGVVQRRPQGHTFRARASAPDNIADAIADSDVGLSIPPGEEMRWWAEMEMERLDAINIGLGRRPRWDIPGVDLDDFTEMSRLVDNEFDDDLIPTLLGREVELDIRDAQRILDYEVVDGLPPWHLDFDGWIEEVVAQYDVIEGVSPGDVARARNRAEELVPPVMEDSFLRAATPEVLEELHAEIIHQARLAERMVDVDFNDTQIRTLVRTARSEDGFEGFTFNPATKDFASEGKAVALSGHEGVFRPPDGVWDEDLLTEAVSKWAARPDVKQALQLEGNHIGLWVDGTDPQARAYIDVSRVVGTHAEARELAAQHQQLAYFDIDTFTEFYRPKKTDRIRFVSEDGTLRFLELDADAKPKPSGSRNYVSTKDGHFPLDEDLSKVIPLGPGDAEMSAEFAMELGEFFTRSPAQLRADVRAQMDRTIAKLATLRGELGDRFRDLRTRVDEAGAKLRRRPQATPAAPAPAAAGRRLDDMFDNDIPDDLRPTMDAAQNILDDMGVSLPEDYSFGRMKAERLVDGTPGLQGRVQARFVDSAEDSLPLPPKPDRRTIVGDVPTDEGIERHLAALDEWRDEVKRVEAHNRSVAAREVGFQLNPDAQMYNDFVPVHELGHVLDLVETESNAILKSRLDDVFQRISKADNSVPGANWSTSREHSERLIQQMVANGDLAADEVASARFVTEAYRSDAVRTILTNKDLPADFRSYAVQPTEMWARAFAQKGLRASGGTVDEVPAFGHFVELGWQWSEDEFDHIDGLVDDVLESWGYKAGRSVDELARPPRPMIPGRNTIDIEIDFDDFDEVIDLGDGDWLSGIADMPGRRIELPGTVNPSDAVWGDIVEVHARRRALEEAGTDPELVTLLMDRESEMIREARQLKDRWQADVKNSIARGDISPDDAVQRWGRSDALPESGSEWEPLPDRMFHVTTNSDEVLDAGRLMSRGELADAGLPRTGLGGGPTDTISLTGDADIAEAIQESLSEAVEFVRGDITLEDLRDASPAFWDQTQKLSNSVNHVQVNDVDGVLTLTRRNGEVIDNLDTRLEFIKMHQASREFAGEGINPLIFGGRGADFADIDIDKIKILEVAPTEGAHGWQVNALGEWRVPTGDVLRIGDDVSGNVIRLTDDIADTPLARGPRDGFESLIPPESLDEAARIVQPQYRGALDPAAELRRRHPDLDIDVTVKDDRIILRKVVVPEDMRRSGAGTRFMNDLLDEADMAGKDLFLTPDSAFGGNERRLREFYRRFGFENNRGRTRDADFRETEAMWRQASPTNAARAREARRADSAVEALDNVNWGTAKGAPKPPPEHIARDARETGDALDRATLGLRHAETDPKVFGRINASVEDLYQMPEPDAAVYVQDNVLDIFHRSDPNHTNWYAVEHERMKDFTAGINEQVGPGGIPSSLEQHAAVTAVMSPNLDYGVNKLLADRIVTVLARNDAFDVTDEMAASFRKFFPDDTPIRAGSYRPSELPAKFLAGEHPEIARKGYRLRSTDNTTLAIEMYRSPNPGAQFAGHGAKRASFYRNFVDPYDNRFVTLDTWHYRAMAGVDRQIKVGDLVAYPDEFLTGIRRGPGREPLIGWETPPSKKNPLGKPKKVDAQKIFQQGNGSTTMGVKSSDGGYLWHHEQTVRAWERALDDLDPSQRQDLTLNAFQARVWEQKRLEARWAPTDIVREAEIPTLGPDGTKAIRARRLADDDEDFLALLKRVTAEDGDSTTGFASRLPSVDLFEEKIIDPERLQTDVLTQSRRKVQTEVRRLDQQLLAFKGSDPRGSFGKAYAQVQYLKRTQRVADETAFELRLAIRAGDSKRAKKLSGELRDARRGIEGDIPDEWWDEMGLDPKDFPDGPDLYDLDVHRAQLAEQLAEEQRDQALRQADRAAEIRRRGDLEGPPKKWWTKRHHPEEGWVDAEDFAPTSKAVRSNQSTMRAFDADEEALAKSWYAINRYHPGRTLDDVVTPLRQGRPDRTGLVSKFDGLFEDRVTSEDMVLYRGTGNIADLPGFRKNLLDESVIGHEFSDLAYSSTTEAIGVGDHYSKLPKVRKVKVPPGDVKSYAAREARKAVADAGIDPSSPRGRAIIPNLSRQNAEQIRIQMRNWGYVEDVVKVPDVETVMRVRVPAGSPAVRIPQPPFELRIEDDFQWLLHRGAKYKVSDVSHFDMGNGVTKQILDVEVSWPDPKTTPFARTLDDARKAQVDVLRAGLNPDDAVLARKSLAAQEHLNVLDPTGELAYNRAEALRLGGVVQSTVADDGVETLLSPPVRALQAHFGDQRASWDNVRSVPQTRRAATADAYEALPVLDPKAVPLWEETAGHVRRQYELLEDMGIKFEFVNKDPYPSYAELYEDFVTNGRVKVMSTKVTGGAQQIDGITAGFTDEVNDMFRAIHDVFGHLGTGRGFDRHGEEAAFLAHASMFPDHLRGVLTTELRAQTNYLIERGGFADQKLALLPRAMWKGFTAAMLKARPASPVEADRATAHVWSAEENGPGRTAHASSGRRLPL